MLRLRQICLVAAELGKPVEDLTATFGLATCFHDPAVAKYGLENALLPVGPNFLEVVAPIQPGTTAERYLARRGGDGGYIVILQCDDTRRREVRMARIGVRIINRLDYGDYLGLQLHPRDTGGAMIETSEMTGDQSPDGPWHPAGDRWKTAMRTEVVTAMTAAELQSDEPGALASRWSEVLEVPLGSDAAGRPALSLENATIRFVPAMDGRGDGLGGVDLAVADRAHILSEAAKRKCRVDGDTVTVCGTRFNLV